MPPPATQVESVELTVEQREERAEIAFRIQERIKLHLREGRESLMGLCRELYEFNEVSGWESLGFENQTDWLADPDIGMTKTAFFRMVRRHRELVVFRAVPEQRLLGLDPSKLDIVMVAIESNKFTVDNVLSDVQDMGARDLREKYVAPSQPPPKSPEAEDVEGESDDAQDEDHGDVIEGHATNQVDTPIDEGKEAKAADKAIKEAEKLADAIAMFDSHVTVGGDRRKAVRSWKSMQVHPALQALAILDAYVQGGEDAPDRTDARSAWALVGGMFEG